VNGRKSRQVSVKKMNVRRRNNKTIPQKIKKKGKIQMWETNFFKKNLGSTAAVP
jgi:hypothetical protein